MELNSAAKDHQSRYLIRLRKRREEVLARNGKRTDKMLRARRARAEKKRSESRIFQRFAEVLARLAKNGFREAPIVPREVHVRPKGLPPDTQPRQRVLDWLIKYSPACSSPRTIARALRMDELDVTMAILLLEDFGFVVRIEGHFRAALDHDPPLIRK